MVGRSATVGRLNFEKRCIRERSSGSQSLAWRHFLWDCSVFLGMNSLVFCKRKGWKRICLYCSELSASALSLPPSVSVSTSHVSAIPVPCICCPPSCLPLLFPDKMLLSSACGDLTEVRWYLGERAEGWRSWGLDHSVVYSFQLLIFRPVPWLYSAVASPFKSELLGVWEPISMLLSGIRPLVVPLDSDSSVLLSHIPSPFFLFSRNLLKLISVSLLCFHLFRLYFLTCSLNCHYFLFLYSFVNFNTYRSVCNHLRIQSNTTTPVSFLLYSFIVTLLHPWSQATTDLFPPPLFCLLRCHKCIHMQPFEAGLFYSA